MTKIAALLLLAGGCIVGEDGVGSSDQEVVMGAPNAAGQAGTYVATASGKIDTTSAFFASLGTNQRNCGHCHEPQAGWTINPTRVQQRFTATNGMDPLFRLVDGASSPLANVSTVQARQAAYSMLLSKALIRVGIGIPQNAEFRLLAVDDPYGFASAAELSLFRRPMPTTSLPYLATVMWDGRETTNPHELELDLTTQAGHATLGHAQATSIVAAQMQNIVGFETKLFTAQVVDRVAGRLDDGALGGPEHLAQQEFYIGINDPLGGNPTGAPFTSRVFTLFDGWKPPANPSTTAKDQRRYAIWRGQLLFNTKPIAIKGVRGLNDALGQATINGTCTLCHDAPNIGNHSVPLPIDIGLSDESRRTPDMPLYTLQNKTTGQTIKTTDPGRALITGRWADLNKFKGPILRGASGRPPFFHNGSAATLRDVVLFYNQRFQIGFTSQEIDDLTAFLEAL